MPRYNNLTPSPHNTFVNLLTIPEVSNTEGYLHGPAAAVASDDFSWRESLVGRKQSLVAPLAFRVAHQNQLHRLRTGSLIPADILNHLHLQTPLPLGKKQSQGRG